MKRMVVVLGIFLFFASMVLVSYAEMTKTPISRSNLPDLKGKWVGTRTVGPGDKRDTELQLFSDTPPVKGQFVFYGVQRPGKATKETQNVDFTGKINEQGNIYFKGSNIEVELSLYKEDDKMKLEGEFFWTGTKGTMSFKKK